MDRARARARRSRLIARIAPRARCEKMPGIPDQEPNVEDGFQRIASLAEVPEGEIRAYDLAGGHVAVVRVEQELFAIGDECPHDQSSLAEGELGHDEDSVICPGDGSEFDLRTGEPLEGPAVDPLAVFPVRERDGWIEIGPAVEGGG
jgi:3-phenylpropionate/trans-cinnamate dioxygenase ferredoxin subunit